MKMYGIMTVTYLSTNTLGHDSFYYSRIKKGEILDKKMNKSPRKVVLRRRQSWKGKKRD
jgi:hypothetical protein